jgi:hypothetical protein
MSLAAKLPYDHPFAGGFNGIGSQPLPTDADALDYLARVKTADGAGVEQGVAMAVDGFVKGCKADGIWDAIKASCIMAGARTLTGALVPLRRGTELWDSAASVTVADAGGSGGEWNPLTQTMSNASGTLVYFPIFTFASITATAGRQYRITGTFSGDHTEVSRITFGGVDTNYPASSSSSFDFTITAASSGPLAINLQGSAAPSSVTIESLSIREDFTPTPYNLTNFDYDRSTGLKGDGSTTYLDSGRAGNADGEYDRHVSVFVDDRGTKGGGARYIASGTGNTNDTFINNLSAGSVISAVSNPSYDTVAYSGGGFLGSKRSISTSFDFRVGGTTTPFSRTSGTPNAENFGIFCQSIGNLAFSDARLAFYSIGSAISDLALLDTRITAYVAAVAAALA